MTTNPDARRGTRRSRALTELNDVARALGVATVGAALFYYLGLPAPALIGAVTATTAAALAGKLGPFPKRWRDVVFVALGSSMGSAVTAETLSGVARWPGSMVALAVAVTAMTASSYFVLRRGFGWDRTTAFYASPPGALSATLALAATTDADMSKVAVAQVIRVFILTMAAPIAIVATGGHAPASAAAPLIASAGAIAAVIGAGIAGALIFHRFRIPGGLMVGAFLASAILHASGLVVGRPPWWMTLPFFVALGAIVGTRFVGLKPSLILSLLKASLASFFVTAALGIGFAVGIGWTLGLPSAQVFVAFAPGALETMMLTAFLLGLDPAYVGAHHVARFLALSFAVPLAARLVGASAPAEAAPEPTDEDV
ncbi:AbrB family transcriptional regulator [Chelatococcus sambhunathii]|uniref:AbrB family transcriptional regulator n=1 Tax=Chelatococcus sambhunathii TaxID=363953 RepID=A0ABU1DFM6_9HYPH|nr:AbrB family transcriptional regulator [Chelatococcus sambhunathii]MDR4306901.1 AbrB family transcriptional regulator [Chelatococcus sambhunathii]